MALDTLVESSQRSIRAGSKSFSLASTLLRKESREAAFLLYHWCRYCDDQIDSHAETENRIERFRELASKTSRAIKQDVAGLEPPFLALAEVSERHALDEGIIFDFLAGLKTDTENPRFQNFEQLERYCYGVAGTVGRMMAQIFGCSDPALLKRAESLGKAMQITNICRDIADDAKLGRVYLPQELLAEEGLDQLNFLEAENKEKLFRVVERLLGIATLWYQQADAGIAQLDRSVSIGVRSARLVYAEIGHEILRRGPLEITGKRVVVSKMKKLFLVLRAVFS